MIALVASLVERSRGPDLRLQLSTKDYNAIAGGKVGGKLKYINNSKETNKRLITSFYPSQISRVFHFYINKSKII